MKVQISTRECNTTDEALDAIAVLLLHTSQFSVVRQNGQWVLSWPTRSERTKPAEAVGPEVA